jgi:hypothetical protein
MTDQVGIAERVVAAPRGDTLPSGGGGPVTPEPLGAACK